MKSPKKRETMADKMARRTQLGGELARILMLNSTLIVGNREKLDVEKALREWDADLKP